MASTMSIVGGRYRAARRVGATALLFGLLATGCGGDDSKLPEPQCKARLVTGPVTGPITRFALVGLVLPYDRSMYSIDVDGDGHSDNALSSAAGILGSQQDLVDDVATAAIINSGAIAASIEVQSDDPMLSDDPTVSVRWHAHADDPGVEIFGRLVAGHFVSNPTPCLREPLEGRLRLPLIVDADPVDVPLVGTALDFDNEGTSLTARLQGAVPANRLVAPVFFRFNQMVHSRPWDHYLSLELFDTNLDGEIALSEFEQNDFIKTILGPDVQLFRDGAFHPVPRSRQADSFSVGLSLFFKLCPDGRCIGAAPSCLDRARNGDESDVDCGGSCRHCAGSFACGKDDDCESRRCSAGHCEAPSCSDGVKNAGEADVDCGDVRMPYPPSTIACPPCKNGAACVVSSGNLGCTSGFCQDGVCAPCVRDSDCFTPPDAHNPTFCDHGVCNAQCSNNLRDVSEVDVDCGGPCRKCTSGQMCTQSSDCVTWCRAGRCF